jgi:energy-coupling factor transporter ATP-binding protein EcfA2
MVFNTSLRIFLLHFIDFFYSIANRQSIAPNEVFMDLVVPLAQLNIQPQYATFCDKKAALIQSQYNRIARNLAENTSRNQKRILIGPTGCGKTTTLYQIVRACSLLDNWVVFHVIDCEQLLTVDKLENVCREILKYQLHLNPMFANMKLPDRMDRKDVTIAQFIRRGLDENTCVETCQQLIHELCLWRDNDKRVLFAFDRWNILLEQRALPNSLVKEIAHWFTFEVSNGCALFCTTSEFSPYELAKYNEYFPGATSVERSYFIKFYEDFRSKF